MFAHLLPRRGRVARTRIPSHKSRPLRLHVRARTICAEAKYVHVRATPLVRTVRARTCAPKVREGDAHKLLERFVLKGSILFKGYGFF